MRDLEKLGGCLTGAARFWYLAKILDFAAGALAASLTLLGMLWFLKYVKDAVTP